MARIRTIKPEFFTSLTIADLPLTARLTFIGLWTHVDDDGRCVDEPRLVRAAVWPLDDRTAADVENDLRALHDASLIVRYEHAGRRYLAVRSWREHQRIDKPKPSKLPAPETGSPTPPTPSDSSLNSKNDEFPNASGNNPGPVPDASQTGPGSVPVGKEQGTGNREGNRESGARPREQRAPAAPPAPALSLIPTDWQPSQDDIAAAQSTRLTNGEPALTGAQLAEVTRKFVRRQAADRRAAANWGSRWQEWAERERPVPDIAQGAFLMPLPGGADPAAARRNAARDDLDQIAAELRAMNGGTAG
ncbi:hypothetical protein ACFY8S_09200 [Streptomyces hygroscopicus]|uniref:hypothetical protein n=1 Tax=Streptomyces hygroscopicus TaxID=1912 RepID=UPI0036942B1E